MVDAGAPARVLLIDADAHHRRSAARALRDDGLSVTEAGSAEDGLEAFRHAHFELVLAAIATTGQDGAGVCRSLRATPAGATLPILMLAPHQDGDAATGEGAQAHAIKRVFAEGATDVLSKPVDGTLLSHRVRCALAVVARADDERQSAARLARSRKMAAIGCWRIGAGGQLACSNQLARLFGTTPQALALADRAALLERVVHHDRERVRQAREALTVHGTPYEITFKIVRNNGSVRDMLEHATRLVDKAGRIAGIEGIVKDVTPDVALPARIHHLSRYDPVTGLADREVFCEQAELLLAGAREGARCAVFHIDLGRFKPLYYAIGSVQGDALLRTVAKRLSAMCLRYDRLPADTASERSHVLARVDQSTFLCFLMGVGNDAALAALAQQLVDKLASPMRTSAGSGPGTGADELALAPRIGIAAAASSQADADGLARCSAQAGAAAQRHGVSFRLFDESMGAAALRRLYAELDLQRAIAGDELQLHFQPVVDVREQVIVGAEALIGWHHPARGPIASGELIDIAEQCGLMATLTDWVLERAGSSLRDWARAGLPGVPLSLNLGAASLLDPQLAGKIAARLARFGLAPGSLKLVMSEAMLMQNADTSIALLAQLRAHGHARAHDEPGPAHAFADPGRAPVHDLIIDADVVANAPQGGADALLALSVIGLGREFGLRVVAQGVETLAQSMLFQQHGCVHQQGCLFSAPVAAVRYEALLRNPQLLFRTVATGACA